MSGYINVRSEFDKTVEVTICERLLFVRASVGLLHFVAAVGWAVVWVGEGQGQTGQRRTPSDQKEDGGGGGPDKRKCHKCGGEGHFKRNCPVKDELGADRAGASPGRNRTDKGIKCFNCHRYGHMSMNCPDKANFYCGDRLGRSVVRVGKVEGAVVSEVVLDTGCSRTMVRRPRAGGEPTTGGGCDCSVCPWGRHAVPPSLRGYGGGRDAAPNEGGHSQRITGGGTSGDGYTVAGRATPDE